MAKWNLGIVLLLLVDWNRFFVVGRTANDRTNSTPEITKTARLKARHKKEVENHFKCLAQIHRAGFQIRKVGVLLDDLELADKAPRRLWGTVQHELHKRLTAAVDAINDRLGKDSIRCGLFPSRGIWQARFERRSPAYTTNWREVMVAR